MVCEYDKIAEAVVYGVEIPNTNGRAGMAAITLADGAELNESDLTEMVTIFKMPACLCSTRVLTSAS